jgi:glycosyltransferase involved in cell wall biosynthesis
VKSLAALGAELTLVTFEKPGDLASVNEVARIRLGLEEHNVRWVPLRYHKTPKVPATAFDCLQGIARSIVSQVGSRPDVIHARTFVGGLMGLALKSILGSQMVYHNEGFYPDEQVDSGVWKLDSAPHRFAKSLERQLYSRADAIFALSHKSKKVIESIPGVTRKKTPVIVVPSCVDLNHFRLSRRAPHGTMRLVYSGSLGGRYSLDGIGKFSAAVSRETGNVHLQVLTKSNPALAVSMLEASSLPDDCWSVDSIPYQSMPEALSRQHAGVHFLPSGLSEHGGSPTKIGEYWAMGLPVVVTPNVSDTDEIIRRERVGVIVESHSEDSYRRAARELVALLGDEDLTNRCRQAAEKHYGLAPACERQFRLYEALISKSAHPAVVTRQSELGKS